MPTYKVGDLVWVHIGGGYGWWPCQVMEPRHTPEQRRAEVLRIKRPGCVLVHCHGDDTFNWYDPRDMEPLQDNFTARAAQKHKSAAVKRYFKLAIEQAQEIVDVRAGRTPATEHRPVDFTRPETYEHLIAPPATEPDDVDSPRADAMKYPAAATAADCDDVGALAVLQWFQNTAAEPAAVCQELTEGASEASAVCMRLLWSLLHKTAVDQHGPDRFSTRKKSAKQKAAAAAAAAGGDGGAAAAGSSKPKQQKGSKRKSDAAAAEDADQQQQQQQPAKKRRKSQQQQQQQGSAAAAASDQGPVVDLNPREYDEHLLRYGGPIPGANLKKAAQFLTQAALNPVDIVSHLTYGHAKSIAMWFRWREAVYENSNCRWEGCVGKLVKGALIRAEAYPVLPPEAPPAAAAAAAAGSSGQPQQQQQQQRDEDLGSGNADEDAAAADSADHDQSEMSESGTESEPEKSDKAAAASRGRGSSRRALQQDHGEQSALAALKAAQGASRQDRIRMRQQQLAAVKHENEHSDHGVGHDDDSSSDWDAGSSAKPRKKQRAGSGSGSSAGAGAAAAAGSSGQANSVDIDVKQYAQRIPESCYTFMSDIQRWGGERTQELKWGVVCGHAMRMSDAHKIFQLVAERGGYDAACQRRAWAAIAREWHPELNAATKNVSMALKKWYPRHLLPYERHVSAGCQVVTKTFGVTAKGVAATDAVGSGGARPKPRTPRKRLSAGGSAVKVKQEPVDDEESDDYDIAAGNGTAAAAAAASDDDRSSDEDHKQDVTIKSEPGSGAAAVKAEPAEAEAAAVAAALRPRRRLPLPPSATTLSNKPAAPAAPAAAAAAHPPGDGQYNEADRRLVKFTFRQEYRLPPFVTVLNAARKWQHDIDKTMIRVYKHRPVASILFSSATIAALAAEGFRKPSGRKSLRVPDDEPFEVELTWLPSRRVNDGRDSASQANARSAAAAAAGRNLPGSSSAPPSEADKCLVKLTFRNGYRLPSIQTVQQAARRFQRDIDRTSIRVFKHSPQASIFLNDAQTAAAAAEQFQQQGRKMLKMPEDELLEVELTWLYNRSGEVIRPQDNAARNARAADYGGSDHLRGPPQQQQQQQMYPALSHLSGPRPMLSSRLPLQQQQQQQFALPGGIVIVSGPPAIGAPPAAAAAPGLLLPGLQPPPVLLDPRRQQQFQQQQGQPPPIIVVSGPPPMQQQVQPQQQQLLPPAGVPPPQPPAAPYPQQQHMQLPQQQQQHQQPAPMKVLPIIDLAALASAIGASTMQQQQPPPQQQQQPMQLLPIQPLQAQLPGAPPQQPQLPIQQLQLPQLQPLPQQQLQQQQQQQPPPWNQADFQAQLQDLLKGMTSGQGQAQ